MSLQQPFVADKGDDPSTVYDFSGLVGRAFARGEGTGNGAHLFWEIDSGFAQGEYRSASGEHFQGSFAFV